MDQGFVSAMKCLKGKIVVDVREGGIFLDVKFDSGHVLKLKIGENSTDDRPAISIIYGPEYNGKV